MVLPADHWSAAPSPLGCNGLESDGYRKIAAGNVKPKILNIQFQNVIQHKVTSINPFNPVKNWVCGRTKEILDSTQELYR